MFVGLEGERAAAQVELAALQEKATKSGLSIGEQKEYGRISQAMDPKALAAIAKEQTQLKQIKPDEITRDQDRRLKEITDIQSYAKQLSDPNERAPRNSGLQNWKPRQRLPASTLSTFAKQSQLSRSCRVQRE